jgi:phosphate butyryltransferase
MVYRTFEELISAIKLKKTCSRMAVAVAADEHTIQAVLHAQESGIVHPVFIGGKERIDDILRESGASVPGEDVVDEEDDAEACRKAVRMVHDHEADFLMKGKVDTKVLLKAVVDKDNGLGTGKLMSHFSIFQVPAYHKLFVPVDGGMVPYPTLEQKREIIENTVSVLHRFGVDTPKVGVLACVEKVNTHMPETVEAAELARMNRSGEITGCIVDGPVSFDCAVSKEIAELKGYKSPIAGDVDVLLAPDIHTGNTMGKMLVCFAGAKMAGFVTGAACPIIVTSRGSSAEEKFYSIVLASAAASKEG